MRPDLRAIALADDYSALSLEALMTQAAQLRDAGHARVQSFSPKVFIPLTQLCRDVCAYCTFAHPPRKGERAFMTRDEILAVAREGVAAGCSEALFTLGDKPELRYRVVRDELASLGHETTISYLVEMCRAVLEETGLLPHVNAGVMTFDEMAALREVSVSQGLMLEGIAPSLSAPGGPHYGSPDKEVEPRLETIRFAGQLNIPFTSGILIGLGETRVERIAALLALRDLHEEYGHIQEIIIQNFRAKPGTRMADAPEPSLDDLLWTIAVSRLIFGETMNIQAPPNLSPESYPALIAAGINDWGGISPVTADHVNPEAPWPHLDELREHSAKAGRHLVARLGIYPEFVRQVERWEDKALVSHVLRASDASGFLREDDWAPGGSGVAYKDGPASVMRLLGQSSSAFFEASPGEGEALSAPHAITTDGLIFDAGASAAGAKENALKLDMTHLDAAQSVHVQAGDERTDDVRAGHVQESNGPLASTDVADPEVAAVLGKARRNEPLGEADIIRLFSARGGDIGRVCQLADQLRQEMVGDVVSYTVNRNINYTNICSFSCRFCAFSKGKSHEALRGRAYDLDQDEIMRRVSEAWERGANEVCMQGGIHPAYTGETYIDIVKTVKAACPEMHVHAFSALEVSEGARTLGISLKDYLLRLRDAGLGTLPGTAAEVLDDEVRDILCADKLTTDEWLNVIETAHNVGLKTTATIMFGHVDRPEHWARHLLRIRALQAKTGGFTEFVPLPFVHMEAPIYLKGGARRGPVFREVLLMHAVARIVLHPLIPNIQASWVKLGPEGTLACLAAGVNDLGGTLMNESISRAAGAAFGQELPPAEMEALIVAAGRVPRQRNTLYGDVSAARKEAARNAAPLTDIVNTAPIKKRRLVLDAAE